ncbi:MAG: hypothetical protein ACTSQE_17100 [Candidatus Heimdallarchaeaceae archaeon]
MTKLDMMFIWGTLAFMLNYANGFLSNTKVGTIAGILFGICGIMFVKNYWDLNKKKIEIPLTQTFYKEFFDLEEKDNCFVLEYKGEKQ